MVKKISFFLFSLFLFIGNSVQCDSQNYQLTKQDLKQASVLFENLSEQDVLLLTKILEQKDVSLDACFEIIKEKDGADSSGELTAVIVVFGTAFGVLGVVASCLGYVGCVLSCMVCCTGPRRQEQGVNVEMVERNEEREPIN